METERHVVGAIGGNELGAFVKCTRISAFCVKICSWCECPCLVNYMKKTREQTGGTKQRMLLKLNEVQMKSVTCG